VSERISAGYSSACNAIEDRLRMIIIDNKMSIMLIGKSRCGEELTFFIVKSHDAKYIEGISAFILL
jgi:hypothetical protein